MEPSRIVIRSEVAFNGRELDFREPRVTDFACLGEEFWRFGGQDPTLARSILTRGSNLYVRLATDSNTSADV